MKIFKASATIGMFTLLSRIMGMVRDLLMAIVVGVSMISDSFFVAFRFPNMFRALFAEGAMNSAFVPIFAKTLNKSKKDAVLFAKSVGTLLLLWIVAFTILMIVFMGDVMSIQAMGFATDENKFDLTVNLAQVMFPYLVFMVMNSLFASILNSFEDFALPAFTPIILNICLILTLVGVYCDVISLTGYELAIAVLVAGILQAGILFIGCIKYGVVPFTKSIKITTNVKDFFKKVLPVVMGSSLLQLNIFIGTILATTLSAGSVSYLYYADRLSQLPLGVIGIAVGIALIPMLSKSIAKNDKQETINNQSDAIIFAMFLTLPATVAFIVMALPIISGLFMYGNFGLNDTYKTAYALQAFAIGLPAFVLIKVLSPVFFARGNTTTPVRISILCMVLNIALSIWLMTTMYHVGIALATSISAWVNVMLLLLNVRKQNIELLRKGTMAVLTKMFIISVIMGAIVYQLSNIYFDNLINGDYKVLYLMIIIITGLVVYFGMAIGSGLINKSKIKSALKK
ncbi:MAG: murein biosynthesis integral membrane protein MurJ [Alphaproteobacteria bacterium]